MKVGLFFGSFNPIHIGHMIIAEAMAESSEVDQVWFVVSPLNPFKKKRTLLHEFDRLDMVRLSIADNPKFNVTDIEFHMPKPSYTSDTLAYLSDKYPQHTFKLIIGEDNLESFPKWKNAEAIVQDFGLLVYPRPNVKNVNFKDDPNVIFIEAPRLEISATFIRNALKQRRSVKYLIHPDVEALIQLKKFYI